MRSLFLNECINPIVDRKAYLVGDEARTIYKSVYGSDPTQSQLDNLVQSTRVGDKAFIDLNSGEATNYLQTQKTNAQNSDPIYQAQRALQFQQEANKPIVGALQAQQQPLQDRYQKLLDSIRGNQQVATNQQTLATNNELGRRGISSNSGVYQQDMVNALQPITQQYNDQYNTAFNNQNSAAQQLALQIAQAQAGDPSAAIGAGANFANSAQSAQQFAQNLALQQQQQRLSQQEFDLKKQAYQSDPLGLGAIFNG